MCQLILSIALLLLLPSVEARAQGSEPGSSPADPEATRQLCVSLDAAARRDHGAAAAGWRHVPEAPGSRSACVSRDAGGALLVARIHTRDRTLVVTIVGDTDSRLMALNRWLRETGSAFVGFLDDDKSVFDSSGRQLEVWNVPAQRQTVLTYLTAGSDQDRLVRAWRALTE